MQDCCHALEIFFKLNEEHFTIVNWLEYKNLHVVLIRGKLATRLLGGKQELVIKPALHSVVMVLSTVANMFLTPSQAILIHVKTLITTLQASPAL